MDNVIHHAQQYLQQQSISGWLLYDYRGSNPIFWDIIGDIPNVTRPCWLWIPMTGHPALLVSYVDRGRFSSIDIATSTFVSRQDMVERLLETIPHCSTVAMEYSPGCDIPRISKIDAGTIELVRSLGVIVVSSSNLIQFATQRWNNEQLKSHKSAADKLGIIVREAFLKIEETLGHPPTEFAIAEFIRQRFKEEGLQSTDGPVVAINEHSSDPHFEPTPINSKTIHPGDWVLIDLWGRLDEKSMFADITWTAYVGNQAPKHQQQVFEVVIGARDTALDTLIKAFDKSRPIKGCELDQVARDYIYNAGYGDYFRHRLGHSLGKEVHGNAVNLDSWETNDTREVIPGIAITMEPGIYLPDFGVRSEIDIYISEAGPAVTTPVQEEIVLITP